MTAIIDRFRSGDPDAVREIYRTFGGPRNRWGDYSGISVDPSNEKFFWVFNEYALMRSDTPDAFGGDGRWGTAWGRTK